MLSHARRAVPTTTLATALMTAFLGMSLVPAIALAGVPEASGPVCVPYPGMPCPGSASSSGSGRSSYSSPTYSTGSRSAKPSTNAIMLKELQNSIDQMFTPNPETLRKIRQTQLDGAQAQQEAVQSQQTAEEQHRLKTMQDAEAARLKQLQDLAGSLQGLPGTSTATGNVRPGGTAFFGLGGGAGDPTPDTRLEGWRAAASSGFDTAGPLAGTIPPAPPPATPPTPVLLEEKPIPPEKITPEIQALLDERVAVRERKQQLQKTLDWITANTNPTNSESASLDQLRQELDATLNKEDYLTFSINEALP